MLILSPFSGTNTNKYTDNCKDEEFSHNIFTTEYMTEILFKMEPHQKINHFPSSYEITRKDRLCFNLNKMQERYGKENFDFVPDTYILPSQFREFNHHF